MEKIVKTVMNSRIYTSIVIVIIAVILYTLISRTIDKILEKDKKYQKLNKKKKTMFKLFHNVLKYVIMIIAIILILQVYGVNVTSLVAGLGLVSVIAGLAIQDPLKDMIAGMNIVSDEYFALGDVLKIDDFEGKVIEIGVRATKLRNIKNNDILVIANRNINKAIRVSNQLYISVPISYEDETEKIDKILTNVAKQIKDLEYVQESEYLGLSEFCDSSITYKLKILCNPEHKIAVNREANQLIKSELDKNGVSIPYPQLTIHNS